MRGMLGIAALLALAGGQPVPLTGSYLYKVQAARGGESPLSLLAAALWNGEDRLPSVLAANGISDPRKVPVGRVLRVPPPLESDERQNAFLPGLRLDVTPRGAAALRVDCDPCAGSGLALRVADADDVVRVPLMASGSFLDLRAWELPDGDVLLAVKTASESGRIALFRLAPGPKVELLQALEGDGGTQVVLRAAIERNRFVLTATRKAVTRQRFVYDVGTGVLTAEAAKEVSR